MFLRLCAIAVFLGGLLLSGASAATSFAENFRAAAPPEDVPELSFEDADGKPMTLADFRGRVVVLNLWATWCGPCVAEMPSLDALQARFDPKKLAVVALNEDHAGHDAAPLFYKRHELSHLSVYVDTTGRAPSRLRARSMPTTLILDPNGREIGRIAGGIDWNAADVLSFLTPRIGAP